MEKRSPEEILQAIEDAPLDDEMERVLAMTPEERRRELEAAGVDLVEVRAAADAVHEKMQGGEREPRSEPWPAAGAPVVPIARARRWQRAAWLSAAAAAVLLVGALGVIEGPAVVAWLRGTTEPILPDNEPPRPQSPRELAERARDEADQACAARLLGTCRDKLDEARRLDPAGEAEERVQRLREVLGNTTKPPPDPKQRPRQPGY
jgi:hypothetical protein